jgi:hypothetical protein
MAELLDCMVNYFGFNDTGARVPRRYYCYLVVAGPGPAEESGVATVTTLAVHAGDRPCDYCQSFFFAHQGGPEAALSRALLYLDRYHEGLRLRKAASQVRRTTCQTPAGQRTEEPGLPEKEPVPAEVWTEEKPR